MSIFAAKGPRSAMPTAPDPRPTVVTWAASADRLGEAVADRTHRLVVRGSVGGRDLRVRLSNAFGERPVTIGPVYVGTVAAGAEVSAGTNRPLTFDGAPSVTIPPGGATHSDPLSGRFPAQADLAVSLYVADAAGTATGHVRAGQTSYIAKGDQAARHEPGPYVEQTRSWPHLDAITVRAEPGTTAVVTLGDSITDGSASTDDTNRRWPDFLARRLLAGPAGGPAGGPAAGSAAGSVRGVANAGISGNMLLADGSGESALNRLDRDVLSHAGVRTVVLLEGVNDTKADPTPSARSMIAALEEIAARVGAAGLRLAAGTIMPFHGWPAWSEAAEAVRQEVNAYIRTAGTFDAVIDFDRTARDPRHPVRLLAEFDCGDHLHPNDAGMEALAETVDLGAL